MSATAKHEKITASIILTLEHEWQWKKLSPAAKMVCRGKKLRAARNDPKKSSFQAENHRDASFVSSLKRRGMKVEKPFCARLSANVIFPLPWTK